MQGITNDERYAPGVKMIEENHNLKQRVTELEKTCEILRRLWIRAIDQKAELEEEMRREREIEEMVQGIRVRSRAEIAQDKYLRRVYHMEEQPRRAGGWIR